MRHIKLVHIFLFVQLVVIITGIFNSWRWWVSLYPLIGLVVSVTVATLIRFIQIKLERGRGEKI